jgi:hypothetical protein
MHLSKKSLRKPYVPTQRDLGLEGPPGKGSRPRNCFSNDFKNNFDAALKNSPPAEGFKPAKGGRIVKKYK